MSKKYDPEYGRAWRARNREKVNAYARKWRKENPDKAREAGRKWLSNNQFKTREYYEKYRDKSLVRDRLRYQNQAPDDRRDARMRRHYRITLNEWYYIFIQQGQKCACCGDYNAHNKSGWHTDHDHVTGLVRGIVCHFCNRGGGKHADTVEFAYKRWRYLMNHSTNVQCWLSEYRRLHGEPVLNKKIRCKPCRQTGIVCESCSLSKDGT